MLAMEPRNRWRRRIERVIRNDGSARPKTEALLTIDEIYARKTIDLAMRIAEGLMAVGASANEVALAVMRVAAALGVRPVHVDVTYNSITVSYHRADVDLPITLLRVVRAPVPDHTKLQRLHALLVEIEGGLDLDEARTRFHTIRRTSFPYRPAIIVLAQASVVAGVCVMFGATWVVTILAFLAGTCAAVAQRGMARLHVPFFFTQIAGALVVTAVAALANWLRMLGLDVFDGMRPTIIVTAGIVLMLAGISVVGAAQDALDGFVLTAAGRMIDLALMTLGVVIGIVIGVEGARSIGVGFALSNSPPTFGAVPVQVLGAVLIAVAVAVWNGASARAVLVSALLGGIAWAGYVLSLALGLGPQLGSGIGALIASFAGILIGRRMHVPSIAVTTAAIVPLVPGSTVFRGLLELAESQGTPEGLTRGIAELTGAGAIGIALAAGASLGLFLGAPVRDTLESVVRRRGRIR